MRWWRGITNNFRQLGWGNGALYLCDRVLRRLSHDRVRILRYLIVAQPVLAEKPKMLRHSTSNSIREIGNADPVVAQFPRLPSVIRSRFDTGARCIVSEVNGKFAGYVWLAFGGYEEDEVRCRYEFVAPDFCAWDFDVYVDPEFRLGRTFARLWEAVNAELAAQGIRWSCSRISMFNPASLAAHRRLGFLALHSATFISIGSLQLSLIGAAPFVHIGWTEGSRPVLRLEVPN